MSDEANKKPSDERKREDRLGDMSGDPQRGGRLPQPEAEAGNKPRPADESARSGIPSRSFDL